MNTKELLGIEIVMIRMLQNTVGRQITTFTVIDGEGRLVTRKIKETIHPLKNSNHIKKISYMLPEIWFTNLQ